MWINYQFMAVCPLVLNFLHICSQKWLVFGNYFGLPNFLPQLANFFTRIYHIYMVKVFLKKDLFMMASITSADPTRQSNQIGWQLQDKICFLMSSMLKQQTRHMFELCSTAQIICETSSKFAETEMMFWKMSKSFRCNVWLYSDCTVAWLAWLNWSAAGFLCHLFPDFPRSARGGPYYPLPYTYTLYISLLPTSIYCCARKFSPEFICGPPSTNSIYIEHQYTINILADIYLVSIPLGNPFLDKPYNQFTGIPSKGGKLCRCPQFQSGSTLLKLYIS